MHVCAHSHKPTFSHPHTNRWGHKSRASMRRLVGNLQKFLKPCCGTMRVHASAQAPVGAQGGRTIGSKGTKGSKRTRGKAPNCPIHNLELKMLFEGEMEEEREEMTGTH